MALLRTEKKIVLEEINAGSGFCLDLGGGDGSIRDDIESLGYRYLNLDINEGHILADADRTLPFPNNQFPLIISTHLLQYITRPRKFFSEIKRCLRKDGKVVLLVPFLHPHHDPGDLWRPTEHGLRNLASCSGLSNIRVRAKTGPLTSGAILWSVVLRKMSLTGIADRLQNFVASLERSAFRTINATAPKWAHSLVLSAECIS